MSRMPVTFQERIPMPIEMPLRPGGPASAGYTPNDILRAIRQRIFLVLFVWIFLVAVTIGGTLVWARYYPGYDAMARVLVESPKPQMPYTLTDVPVTPDVQERILADQAILVKSDDVLLEVIRDADVMNTSWYKAYPEEKRPTMILDLQNQLSVSPIKGTSYLAISMRCRNPEDPHVIVNSVVQKYLYRADALSRRRYNEQLDKYKQERERLDQQIREVRTRRENFITTQLGMVPGVTQGLNVVADQLRIMTTEAARLETEKVQYRAIYDSLTAPGVSARSITISPQMRMMIESDPKVANLSGTLATLQQNRRLVAQSLGDRHRQIADLDAQIAAVEQQLSEELAVKEDQVRQYEVDQAEMSYLNATEAGLQLDERLMELKEQQRDLDRQLAQLQSMEEEQARLEKNYELVSDYTRILDIILNQNITVRVELVANAVRPLEPSSPRWMLNLPVGTMFGLVVAIGLALLLEFADTSVRTPRDVVRHVHVPILGTVPDVDDEEVVIDKVELAAHTAPRSMIAEAFRGIRTSLMLSAPAERQRTLLVTSPRPEDGKTTIAANLAISIAQSGRRVLLVDANFRRPTIHQFFPHPSNDGLSNVLVGLMPFEDAVRTTALPNLDVLLAGPIPPNPAELLSSPQMRDLVSRAVERYDQVVFDGPPCLLVSDALVTAGLVDGVILVCRAKANSRGIALRAKEQLERVNAHLFGAVLNGAQVRRGGYFREQFRTFYDYQPEELPAGVTVALPTGGGGDGRIDADDKDGGKPA